MHQAGVVVGVGGNAHVLAQAREKQRPPHLLQLAPLFQEVIDGDQVHRLMAVVEVEHHLVDPAVGLPVEILGGKGVGHQVHDLGAEQNGPQNRLFRLRTGRGSGPGRSAGSGETTLIRPLTLAIRASP